MISNFDSNRAPALWLQSTSAEMAQFVNKVLAAVRWAGPQEPPGRRAGTPKAFHAFSM